MALIAVVGLGAPFPARASGTFTVGSFTKSTSAAPVTQAVAHGVGSAPKAIIFWTNGKTSTSLGSGFLYGFGMTDGTTSKSIATSSDDNQSTSRASRRIANKALTIINGSGTLQAEADLQSVDATNFTLNWTTNDSTGYVVHFIAIGGSRISAKVLGWTMATATGNQAVTGIGFRPDVVIAAHGGGGLTSAPRPPWPRAGSACRSWTAAAASGAFATPPPMVSPRAARGGTSERTNPSCLGARA